MERTAMNWKNTTPNIMRNNVMKKAKLLLVLFAGIVAAHASAETVTYYATDQLGSPIAAMDSSGSLLWWESYNPYGEKRRSPSSANGDTGYTGHQHDSATGLTYMQARYYDPVIGRFLANDPVGFAGHLNGTQGPQGFNRYAYVNNNPYSYVDPDGRRCESKKGITTCTPENDDFEPFSFPTPEGWEDFGPDEFAYHEYTFVDSGGGAPVERLEEELVKSPTNDANAATEEGALNDVGPLFPGSREDNVISYITNEGIINVTLSNHFVRWGFVMRKIDSNGNIVTYGEGNSLKQLAPGAKGQARRFWSKNAEIIVQRAMQ